jgi:hypothetical protein
MDAIAALLSMKLDYVLTAYTTAFVAVRNNSGLQIVPRHLTNEGAGVAVSKENKTGLLRQIDSVLTAFKSDGTLERDCGALDTDRRDGLRGTDFSTGKFFRKSPDCGNGRKPRTPFVLYATTGLPAGRELNDAYRTGSRRKVQFDDMNTLRSLQRCNRGR